MSGVLKGIAIVIGVAALAITGIGLAGGFTLAQAFAGATSLIGGTLGLGATLSSALVVGALAMDLSMLAGALVPKPSTGGSQTKWKADPYAGIPYVMGRTLISGNIVYRRGHGSNNTYNTFVTILSLGPIQSIDASYMDKSAVSYGGGGAASGSLAGQVWQKTQLGTLPQATALVPPVASPPGWTSAHKLSGLAAAMNSFAYDSQNEGGLTAIPQPAWIVKGVKVYDPRLDSTYPGGSGSCRAFDESTYVWSENPHLHGLTWAIGRYHNGVRVAGIGIGSTTPSGVANGIDVASFVEGANLDDARSWKVGGQVYTRPDTPWNSLKAMLQAGGAMPVLIGGKITAINRAPRVSLATIGPGDVVGECSFASTQPRRTRINGIIPQYRSEPHDWEVVPASLVQVTDYVTMDGDERTREVAYPLVQNVNQVAQLAAYDICDAREAGPISVPLKPGWLNYRIGDCLTFAPEDGYSIKVEVVGRAIDAQSATVTLTLRGETDGKHAFALGQTGVAPEIVSLSYSNAVAAPDAGDWSLAGTTLSANGASIPALVLTGTLGNPSADAILVDYRPYVSGADPGANWSSASIEPPTMTRKEFTSVTPGTDYEVGIRYRVRGVIGARQIEGPVTAGELAVAGLMRLYIQGSWQGLVSITGTPTTITIGTHTRYYADKSVSVTGTTLTTDDTGAAIAANVAYALYYDDATRAGGAVTWKATPSFFTAQNTDAHPARHFAGSITTPTSGTSTGGGSTSGGSGGTDPYYCVSDDTPVLLADGREVPARALVTGQLLRTRHEDRLDEPDQGWGEFPIEAVRFAEDDVFRCVIDNGQGPVAIRATGNHRFWLGGEWVRADAIGTPDGRARIARITVADAHTYVSAGVLSHNIKMDP